MLRGLPEAIMGVLGVALTSYRYVYVYIHIHCLPVWGQNTMLAAPCPLLVKVMPWGRGVYSGRNKSAGGYAVIGRAALPRNAGAIPKDGGGVCDRSRRKQKSGSCPSDRPLLGVVILVTSSRR